MDRLPRILSSSSSSCGHLHRVLYPGNRVLYVDIPPGVFDNDEDVFAPDIITILPPTIPESANYLEISAGFKRNFSVREMRGIPRWHARCLDILQLPIVARYNSFVFETIIDGLPAIAKYARFEHEVDYFQRETDVYRRLCRTDIGPRFIAHLSEAGRVIGFALEKVIGRQAGIQDFHVASEALQKLHSIGMRHGDVNRYNFIITETRAVLVDFSEAREDWDTKDEVDKLREQLASADNRGYYPNAWEAISPKNV